MKKILLLVYIVLCTLTCFSQVNLSQGLMAYYPFTGNANDASGNNNNPVFNNATLTRDRFGNANAAYHFNGSSSYMQIPNAPTLNFNKSISVVAWVKISAFNHGLCHGNRVIMKADIENGPGAYAINFDDANYTSNRNCSMPEPDTLHEAFDGVSFGGLFFLQKNQWYCVVYTNDGTTINAYVNCQLVDSGPSGGLRYTNSYDLFFGKFNNSPYFYWFNGDLDDVRIYNRALSKDEVLELCKKDPAPVNAPAADFTFSISNCNKVNFEISKAKNIKTFKWDLGDKTTAVKESFTHLYKDEGNYTAKLIATGTNGKEIIISKTFTIRKQTVAFSYAKATGDNSFTFTSDNKQKLQYKWLFGDGESSDKVKKIVHTYKQPGNYNVLLIAENKNGCIDTAIQIITVVAPAQPVKDTIVTTVNTDHPDSVALLPEKRQNNLLKEIAISSDSISVSFYDNAEIDGDSVTIVYNNKVIITHLFLTDQPKTFKLPVDKTIPANELIMYAENLGSIPPNTALMIVYDDKKRYEISISSSKTSNGMVSFIFNR